MFVRMRMTKGAVSVHEDSTLAEAWQVMEDKAFEGLPVTSNGKIIGLLTAWDVMYRACQRENPQRFLDTTKVSEVMVRRVITVSPDDVIERAAFLMRSNDISLLPVVEGERLVGIITQSDLFEVFTEMVGFNRRGTRITLQVEDRPGRIADIAQIVKRCGCSIIGIATFSPAVIGVGNVVLRIRGGDTERAVRELEEHYKVIHVTEVTEDY